MSRATPGRAAVWLLAGMVLAALPATAAAQSAIDGRVRIGSQGIRHVSVEVIELGLFGETDATGRYRLEVPPAIYTIALRLGGFEAIERGVTVAANRTTTVDTTVEWPLAYVETLTVTAPARFAERIVDSASAATAITGTELRTQATGGQLPRMLAFTPGVEITQSGLFDFNLNARGFNSAINRHVKTLIDGRDPSVPVLLGYQDWAANLFPLDEIASVEFIRGPGTALYGAGAFSGVLSVTMPAPRDTLGGFARFTFGELGTRRLEARHAARINDATYIRVFGGYHHSRDFSRPRVESTEYTDGALPRELVPPPRDALDIAFGAVRIDRDFGPRTLTSEVGASQVNGLTTVTRTGRSQAGDTLRPWARASFVAPRWTAAAYYTGQDTEDQVGLNTGAPLFLSASNIEGELTTNLSIARGRGRVVAGASAGWQHVDSADRTGRQTVFAAATSVGRQAVFGELEYRFSQAVRGLVSGRMDRSALHDTRFSPRAAVVFRLTPTQTMRLVASRAFQNPSVTEAFLATAVAPPVDLSALEHALTPILAGARLGFEGIPVLAVGNRHLAVEKVSQIEAVYGVVIGRKAHVTVTGYRSWLRDFTSDLLPQAGTPLGRLNPDFRPYAPPASLSPQADAIVRGALAAALPPDLLALLSNDATGAPVFAALSWRSFGQARSHGLETAVSYAPANGWRLDGSYTMFDHHVPDPALASVLVPNTPRHQWTAGVTYERGRLATGARSRWVDSFLWSSGIFSGPVPWYTVTDVQLLYAVSPSTRIGLDVANLLDNDHYETFGGDLIGRVTLASLRYSW